MATWSDDSGMQSLMKLTTSRNTTQTNMARYNSIALTKEEVFATFEDIREQNFVFIDLDVITENIKRIRANISKKTG